MPLRDTLKFLMFLVFLGTLYDLFLGLHPLVRWSMLLYAGMWSAAMADRRSALRGDLKNPGLLSIVTLSLPLGAGALFVGLPYILHAMGYLSGWRFDWGDVLASFITGLALAALHWVPFLVYVVIDLVCDYYRPRPA